MADKKKESEKRKTRRNTNKTDDENSIEEFDEKMFSNQLSNINIKLEQVDKSMKHINNRLDNALTKGDDALKQTLKDFLFEIKEDLLKSVNKNIEVIEGKLFEREKVCDKLQTSVDKLDQELNSQKETIETLRKEIRKRDEERRKVENDHEQYSRRNNLKISGIEDTNQNETAFETASKVIRMLKTNNIYEIKMEDIDIAHRLPNKTKKCRDIIIKFISRNTKANILMKRKLLKGTGVFISEDLSKLNFNVYMSVKRKMPDEVEQVWTKNGTVFYKNAAGQIHAVKFEDYEHWLELPWPEK